MTDRLPADNAPSHDATAPPVDGAGLPRDSAAPTFTTMESHLADKERVMNALGGVIPGTAAMPFLLSAWAPTSFIIAWIAAYLLMTATFSSLILTRPSPFVEQIWSVCAGALFSAVPISAIALSDEAEHFWIAAVVCVTFVAFEMSSLPFLRIGEWRIGVVTVSVVLAVCGLYIVHPIASCAILVVNLAMIHAADRIRTLKLELESGLTEAKYTLRHDPLTNLLNRRGLETRIEQLGGEEVTIALIDVDRFKLINDSHGHDVGDQVLVALGREMRHRLGPEFSLARIGGDEFVAIAHGRQSLDDRIVRPKRVTARLHRQPVHLECGFSIGVSTGNNVDGAQRLLSEASFAMREAKRSRSTICRFGPELEDQLDRTIQVAAIANGFNEHGVFVPVAQTIIGNGRIVGCELLIRWRRPDGEVLMPGQFLSMAADAGLMSTINEIMLEHAIVFAARFNNRPMAPFVSVNISASHLGEANFCRRVRNLLDTHRVPADRLMVEITETEQLVGYSGWEAAARELRDMGVRLAIDDFGTGYSSIERLQHLPISHIKFDRSLVQIVSGPFGEIARGVAGFAKAVNIGVIAEGIETLDELESMRAFDITMFQGFYFHRPESLDAVELRILEESLDEAGVLPSA